MKDIRQWAHRHHEPRFDAPRREPATVRRIEGGYIVNSTIVVTRGAVTATLYCEHCNTSSRTPCDHIARVIEYQHRKK